MAKDIIVDNLASREQLGNTQILASNPDLKPLKERVSNCRFIRLNIDSSEVQSRPETEIAQTIVRSFNIIKYWSLLRSMNLLSEAIDEQQIKTLAEEVGSINKSLDFAHKVLVVYDGLTDAKSFTENDEKLVKDFQQTLQAPELKKFYLSEDGQQEFLDVDIKNLGELQSTLKNKFLEIIHDIANPSTNISGHVQLMQISPKKFYKESREVVNNNIERLSQVIDEHARSLMDEFEFKKQDLSVEQLKELFKKYVSPRFNAAKKQLGEIEFFMNIDGKLEVDSLVEWSETRSVGLFDNLARNALRSFEAKDMEKQDYNKKVRMEFDFSEDGKFLEIRFLNNGKEIPSAIIEKGFRKAREEKIHGYDREGKVSSTGVGMGYEAMVLEDHFGGTIIPSNIEKGGETWAQVAIRLPLQLAN